MATIKELKEDLQFNTGLIELLDIMKNTAVFQFRALQSRRERFEKFFEVMEGFFPFIAAPGAGNGLIIPKTQKSVIIMVTSDKGFMGNLNSQVIELARREKSFKDAELLVVGERGAHQLEELGHNFVPYSSAVDVAQRRSLAAALTGYVVKGVRNGLFGHVLVSYPRPISFMYQKAEIADILPLFKEARNELKQSDMRELIVESPIDGIIDYLAEEIIKQKLIGILEDSKLSEFAARAIHLESSSQELTKKKQKLKLQYFHAYHEMIDKSTRELFSAQIIIRRG